MDKYEPIGRLAGDLTFVAIKAAFESYVACARAGLVSPAEVETFADSLTDHIVPHEGIGGDEAARAEQVEQFRAVLDAHFLPVLARLREESRRNWKG
jgi:hypothetical protein